MWLYILIGLLALAAIAGVVLWYLSTIKKNQPEVYYISPDPFGGYRPKADIDKMMKNLNLTYATVDQLKEAQVAGAQWCSCGYLAGKWSGYPMQINSPGCGIRGANLCGTPEGEAVNSGAVVYGIKPAPTEVPAGYYISPWYQSRGPPGDRAEPDQWSRFV